MNFYRQHLPHIAFFLVLPLAMSIIFQACTKRNESGNTKKKIVIGLVAKSQSNPLFQAAYTGAKDAARELRERYGVEVVIDWQTPPDENAQKQAEAIEQLARAGVEGIAVSCSDANILTPAINKAVELGSTVVCFDSDAPKSKRFRFYGTDDVTCGSLLMQELARAMEEHGTFAILAGNQSAPNLQNRVNGIMEELKKHPGMRLLPDGIFYHPETPEQAAEAVNRAQTTNSKIEGWIFIGGWPLFTRNALKWNPGEIKVVAVDAMPAELAFLESGHVQVLLAQNCYMWGYRSVDMLLKKVLKNEEPADVRIIDPLTRVTKENVGEFYTNWKKWLMQ
jgi:ribose transport system substrate-binding protein